MLRHRGYDSLIGGLPAGFAFLGEPAQTSPVLDAAHRQPGPECAAPGRPRRIAVAS